MIGALLIAAAGGLLLSILAAGRAPRLWLAGVLAAAVGGLSATVEVFLSGAVWDWQSVVRIGGEATHLRLDAVSALFLALLSLVGGTGAVYAGEYWTDRAHPHSAPRGRLWWSVLLLSLGLVLVAANGLHFLVAWEVFTVAAYFLVTLDRRHPEVRAAG
ncbi:MAG TPA: NADH-quinone oxidoreductase subunit H, partial [Terriglobia bacterium]|nr:NADH-quinone oxidoreductase subunit H [Terriglobia bacterium]